MLRDEELLAYCEALCSQADVCYLASREIMRLAELAGETTLATSMRRIDCSDPGFIHAYGSSRIGALSEQARMRRENILCLEHWVEERRKNFLSLAFEDFSSSETRESCDHFDDAYNKWQEAEKLLDYCRKLPPNWRKGDSGEGTSTHESTGDEEPARLSAE